MDFLLSPHNGNSDNGNTHFCRLHKGFEQNMRMERMKRNGLLILFAVTVALALAVCPEYIVPKMMVNSVMAQDPPDPPEPPEPEPPEPEPPGSITRSGLIYFDYTGGGAFPPQIYLGNTATVRVGAGGSTIATPGTGTVYDFLGNATTVVALDKPTNIRPGTVFLNTGGPSYIDALGSGVVISTTTTAPAIQNGQDNSSFSIHSRTYQIRATRLTSGRYELEYGYYMQDDPTQTFYSLPRDEMPDFLGNNDLLDWQDPDTSSVARLPVGYEIMGLDIAPGETTVLGNERIALVPPSDPSGTLGIVYVPAPGYLSPIFLESGTRMQGTLVINQRDSRDPNRHRFSGEARTLIESAGTAIQTYGTLTIYDSRIHAGGNGIIYDEETGLYYYFGSGGAGILIEYSLPGTPTDDTISYSIGTPDSLRLYNTQIGEPGATYTIGFDPDTGEFLTATYGLDVDQSGTPRQIATRIFSGDVITADGVNGRIVAGQNATMKRNPIGTVERRSMNEGAEAQFTNYDISNINGPSIGIHAQANNEFTFFGTPRTVLVYGTSYYNHRYTNSLLFAGGVFDRSHANNNFIQLNDNSWIFAETGISFGNASDGSFPEYDAIRISIDSTSGIYSTGTGAVTPYGIVLPSNSYSYYGSYGITDRYSLVALMAYWGDPFTDDTDTYHRVDGYNGYSGSLHEIEVDGKVITGAPNRAGIQLRFDLSASDLSPTELRELRSKLSNVYYHDPNDEYADRWGNVYYYDPETEDPSSPKYNPNRNAEVAVRFIAYNSQPSRVFWLKIDGLDSVPLTYFDEATQRWTVHPDAPEVRINNGYYSSRDPFSYFTAFDVTFGVAIDIVGTSIAYEENILPPNVAPWSTYYGPTVREITALGNDALIAGGQVYSSGAAMSFGEYSHVAKVIVGENNDVRNLSNVLFAPNNFTQSAKNYQAFDFMTSAKRSKFLYDPNLIYSDALFDDLTPNGQGDYESGRFHFDNAGVHGDIISQYNMIVATVNTLNGAWNGANWLVAAEGTGGGTDEDDEAYSATIIGGIYQSMWVHTHPGPIWYADGGILDYSTEGPSLVIGHRDTIGTNSADNIPTDGWTANDMPGRSLILDEILLYFLAGEQPLQGNSHEHVIASVNDSYGYADMSAGDPWHFREALARFLHYGETIYHTGLTVAELMAGYTRDGTLVIFSNGDIFSGNIYGGGYGDNIAFGGGNIDLRLIDGTTIFNRNILEFVNGSDVYQYAGIRVRDVYVEKTGHILMNDSWFSVNPFIGFERNYAQQILTHDVLNEGIVSGNGIFEIAQRVGSITVMSANLIWNVGVTYYAGHFINRGILAPGLPGFIGENELQARELERTSYADMLKTVSQSSGDVLWQQLMRGVPGGQYGTINILGHLYLMDEHTRPIYDPTSLFWNTDETLNAGEFHVTIGNDTIKDMFGKYVAGIAQATVTFDPITNTYDTSLLAEGKISREDWKIIAVEKLGTHLSWFSPSAMVDKNTKLPLLTEYEQFEYLTDTKRRSELQRKMLAMVLTPTELRLYDSNPAERARMNKRIFEENGIQLSLTPLDTLLWRYGFSDVVSVHGTIPPYFYGRYDWGVPVSDQGSVPPPHFDIPANLGSMYFGVTQQSMYLGVTQLGGIIQADRIYDLDNGANKKDKLTSYIIIASEGYTDGTVKQVTSATTDWVYANVDVMPIKMATGQSPTILTVIDDKHYYRNRVDSVKDSSYNAKSVAKALDKAMFTNPGLAQSFQFGLNSPKVLSNVFRQIASGTRANSVVMNVSSPSDHLFNHIGYGVGGLSTGNRGNVVFRNVQTGQLQQPYGQPAVPPPGYQYRGQNPMYRTGSVWGAYTNSNFTMGDNGNSFKYHFYRNGAIVGSEWNLTPSSVIGGVAMFNEGNLKSLSDEVNSHDYSFGLYLVCAPYEQFEVKSYVGGGFQAYKTDRYIRNNNVFIGYRSSGSMYSQNDIYGINEHYDSESHGSSFNYSIEFARPFTMNPNFVIRPVAGFEYQNVRQNAYTEQKDQGSRLSWANNGSNIAQGYETEGATSGTYAMKYREMTFARTLLRFGVNTESYFARGGVRFRAYHIGRLTGDKRPVSEQSFTSGSSMFSVRGAVPGTSYFQVGTGANLWLNQERTATLFANGDFNFSVVNQGYSMINLSAGFMLNF